MASPGRIPKRTIEYNAWRPKAEGLNDEVEVKIRRMIDAHSILGQRNARVLLTMIDEITIENVEIMKQHEERIFYVLEYPLPYRLQGQRWNSYITHAGAKVSGLYVAPIQKIEGGNNLRSLRKEAIRRGKIWVEECKYKDSHGFPILINLNGNPISVEDCIDISKRVA